MVIHSLEELLEYGASCSPTDFEPIELDGDFILSVRVEGTTWDSRIDRRSAQYVIALQRAIDDLLDEFVPDTNHENVLVRITNRDGSFESLADIKEALLMAVGKVKDYQTFICLLAAICGIGGYFWYDRYLAHEENIMETKSQEQRNQVLLHAIDLLNERAQQDPGRYAQYERPMRILVKSLSDGDSIEIGKTGKKMKAQIARQSTPPRAPRSESQISYADGEYIVNSRRYDEGEIVLELEQHGVKIKGYLNQLDDADKDAFIASLDKHEREDNLPFYMKLQINVEYTQRTLKHGIIMGEGKKCLPLNEIPPK